MSSLRPGDRFGPYEVVSPLGAGGMGEVHRARDTRLSRDVALKVLVAEASRDSSRFRRFEAEARSTAALSHPNIVSVYDVGEKEGIPYIVSELVPGGTLTDLLARAPLPLRKLFDLASGIAEGLAAAHGQGIVHRDLKPDNVLMSADGTPKIADFGLAKYFRPASDPEGSQLMTLPEERTKEGTILGTVGYMSPEQARGNPVDFRSDQFSFGAILYEMATGRRAFARPSAVQTLAAIVEEEPQAVGSINPKTPLPLRWIVDRCLSKDPADRYASTKDLAREIATVRDHLSEATVSGEGLFGPEAAPLPRRLGASRGLVAGFLAGLLTAGIVVWSLTRPGPSRSWSPNRLNITLPPSAPLFDSIGRGLTAMALSPDGRRVVYAAGLGGHTQLYARAMDQLEAMPIPGTEGGAGPFFSPDGQWLGFAAGGKLKKIPIKGGEPLTLCDAPALRGASWGSDGTIIFAAESSRGLSRVSADGGEPSVVTKPDPSKNELNHRWPEILPGGKAVVFSTHPQSGREEERSIALASLETGRVRILVQGASYPRYSATGHLLYARTGSIFATPFDVKRLELTGRPVSVLEDVLTDPTGSGLAYCELSRSGSLLYVSGHPRLPERALVLASRKGTVEPLTQARRPYSGPALSPDGRRLAVCIHESGTGDQIWVYDLTRSTWNRLTSEGENNSPVWSSDGKRVVFASIRPGARPLSWMPADGSGPVEELARAKEWTYPSSSSSDGRVIAVSLMVPSGPEIWMLPLEGDRKLRPFLVPPFHGLNAKFSPDGRWVAYTSRESGRDEVSVRPYPGPGGKWLISTDGGDAAVWARSGRELFYRNGDKMMAVQVQTEPDFSAGTPQALFEGQFLHDFDVLPDGQRFVMVKAPEKASTPLQLVIVPDWSDELKSRFRDARK